MKSFALALVASLAAAQTYEESYSGSASVADVGTTDYTVSFSIVVEETTDKLTTTTGSSVTWEAVLEGDDIAAGDEVEAWACFEGEACVIMRSVGTDNLSVHYTEANGTTLPESDCASANAQPSAALATGLSTVATWNGTTVTAVGTANPELVPQTVSISGKTISMSAKAEEKEVIDLAAIRQAEADAAALLAEQQAAAEQLAAEFEDSLGDVEDILGDLDLGDLGDIVDGATAEANAAAEQAAAELAEQQAAFEAQLQAELEQAAKDALAEASKDIKQTSGLWVKRAGGAATCAQGDKTVQSFAGAGARIADEKAKAEAAEDDGAYALTTIAAAAVAVAALAF